jgi:hypothetical protein
MVRKGEVEEKVRDGNNNKIRKYQGTLDLFQPEEVVIVKLLEFYIGG